MGSHAARLITTNDSLLVLIDFQQRLTPVMAEPGAVTANAARLAAFAGIVGLPCLVTEQDKLGPTVPDIADHLGDFSPVSKISFDCFGETDFSDAVDEQARGTLIVAGIEAHICVLQTVLSALGRGCNVHVVGDAVASRNPENRRLALERMQAAGAVLSSTEMVMYELLGKAGTPEFKSALKLVR